MTKEEINQIPFKFSSHMSMEDEHTTTYSASYNEHLFAVCQHVPFKNGEPKGRTYTHYMVDGKVFKTKEKFYQYCETLKGNGQRNNNT